MSVRNLPVRPDLEQLRHQAKDLHRAIQRGDADAIAELREYSHKIRGIIYRKGWKLLIMGIGAIVLLSILLQYLGTLSSWLTSLSLNWILLLLYVLLLLLIGAYILVALGAQRLTKIEQA